jgi:hypothetical protein
MSIAAGVSASTSEMRAPLLRSVKQKGLIGGGTRSAASTKRRRSATLRYFRLPEGPKKLWLSCGRSRIATEWRILFQEFANCSGLAHSHADAMQIFYFCMAH